jgi:hypothetical protein
MLASEAAGAAGVTGAGGGGAAGALAPIAAQNQGERQPGGSSVAFAVAVLLIGFACVGLWLAFHKPENAETGGFPGLFGQMLQWVHAGENEGGAAAAAGGGSASSPPLSESEIDKLKNLPASAWADLQKLTGGPLGQFKTWILHLP